MVTIGKILITRMKFIGDVVLTTPVIRAVRQKYPHAHISYLAEANAISLLKNNPYLDELIPFNLSNTSLQYHIKMYGKMIFGKYDLTIDLFSNPRTALLTFATRARMRIGGDSRGRGLLYTHRIADDGFPKSAIAYHFQSLAPLGIVLSSPKTEIFLGEDEKADGREILRLKGVDLSKKTISLHPGGTWPAKLWNKEKFVQLAQKYKNEGNNVIVTGGENDREVAESVAQLANIPFIGALPLRTVASILSVVNLVVSNDCGVMHIAVAVDTPTIGIFGPGQENIWFPYSDPHIALRKHVPCNPCHLNVCNRTGDGYMECMNLLSVDEVFETSRKRL